MRTVVVVALLLRLTAALVSFLLNPQYLVPDELQYVQLATTVAHGHPAESWFAVFGQSLYDTTWAFIAPITFLFKVLWPTRLLGQLYAAALGGAAAGLTAALAAKVVRPPRALLAGLVVAVLPSSILWSSVVLRESLVWAALALVALGFTATFGDRRACVLGGLAMIGGLLVLGASRDQVLLGAAWALPMAAVVAGRSSRAARVAGCLLLALLGPQLSGLGPGGWHLVQERFPSLATTRAALSDQAGSAYTPTTLLPTTTTTTTSATPGGPGGPGGPTTTTTTTTTLPTTVDLGDGRTGQVVRAPSGAVYVVDESVRADLEAIPRGIVAVVLRPFPWEGGSFTLRLAALEEPAWYVLYVLAGIGAWSARRRRDVIALPILMAGAILSAEVLFQGNVGTAFRHRAQVLWVTALLAAVGVEHLLARRAGRGRDGDVGETADAGEVIEVAAG